MMLEQEPFDLHGLVESVVRPLALQAFRRGLEMVCELEDGVPNWVSGDARRLRQVLSELIGNAVKFTRAGEIEVRVAGGGAGTEPGIRFVVRDTGVGMAPDTLALVLDEGLQTGHAAARGPDGSGLGLAIARQLVRMMGSELNAASRQGVGSEFAFTLPLEPVAGVAADAPGPDAVLSGRRILVVDGNATARACHARLIESAASRVETAGTAADTLAMLRAATAAGAPFDLLVLDAHLGAPDGFALADEIVRDPAITTPRLLLLARVGVPGDGQRCREHGVSGYMVKPVAREELVDAVHAILADGWSPDFLNEPFVTRYSITESRTSLRILLAEDNPVDREVAVKMLRQRGHTVVAVASGWEAVDAALGAPFDVLLMSVQLPVMDGIEATREIRRHPRLNDLHIVSVATHGSPEERHRCLAAGMNDHLAKPFMPAELFAAVEMTGAEHARAPRPSIGPPASPIDYEGFSAMMREVGAEDAVIHVLQVFVEDTARRIGELEQAITRNAAALVRSLARGGRSAAGTVRAGALADALAALEAAAGEQELSRLPALLADVRAVFDATVRLLGRHGVRVAGA